jgi:hypothetical protein
LWIAVTARPIMGGFRLSQVPAQGVTARRYKPQPLVAGATTT